MSSSSRLAELAKEIADKTKVVDEFVQKEGIRLGFEVDSASAFPSDAPAEVLEARRIVKEATQELNDLVTGPAEHLRWLACRVSREKQNIQVAQVDLLDVE